MTIVKEYNLIDSIKIKLITKDAVFRLLFLNMLFVILGYAAAYALGSWFVPFFRIFKLLFVFITLIFVIHKNGFSTIFLMNKVNFYLVIFITLGLSFFSDKPFEAVYKGLTFMFPLLYIVYSVNYLLQFGAYNLLVALSYCILLVYMFVPLSFLVLGFDIQQTNIYGYQEGEFFVSNHYGWSSALFLLASLTVLRFYPLKKRFKLFILIFIPFVFYVLIISANRAGILSLGLAFLIFFFKDRLFSISSKILLLFAMLFVIGLLSLQDNSAITYIEARNEKQITSGNEGRLIGTNAMLRSFNHNPVYYITGVGMFNYSELHKYGGVLRSYHNSYWEVLFGSGIIVFIIFIKIMVYDPFRMVWNHIASFSLLAIPLIIIPFLESNLTGGQFLFFPWFSYIILLNAKEFRFNSFRKNISTDQAQENLNKHKILFNN